MFWHQTFRLVLDWRGSERSILRRKVASAAWSAPLQSSETFAPSDLQASGQARPVRHRHYECEYKS